MSWMDEYKRKLATPDEAVKCVKSGDWVDISHGSVFPILCEEALSKRAEELYDIKLRGDWILQPIKCVENDPEQEHFIYQSFHFSSYERSLHDRGLCFHDPMDFRDLELYYRNYITTDVMMVAVTPPDENGYFNTSLVGGIGRAFAENCKTLIVEVNENLPWIYDDGEGSGSIHVSQVDYIVEGEHGPQPEVTSKPPTDLDRTVAEYIIPYIVDGATIQVGVGGMPDALCSILADSDLKDLGMHTEFCTNCYMDLYKAGKITNAKKAINPGVGTFATAAGNAEFYEWIDRNPGVASRPVLYQNDPFVIAQMDNVISINACIAIDLFGQVSSESVGFRHISGTGGQMDFNIGAMRSKGGHAFLCLNATRTDRHGVKHSNIVPHFNGEIITTPRVRTSKVVTEFGIVDLQGIPTWQKAEALISIADPDFRDELIEAAEKQHIWRKSNKR